jgi:hypothetical protein
MTVPKVALMMPAPMSTTSATSELPGTVMVCFLLG